MAVRDPVEVYGHWVDPPPSEKEWHSGSGYPLAARLVLTAAHVVCPNGQPAGEVKVRSETGGLAAARMVWHDDVLDVALVEVTDPGWADRRWRQPIRWGQLVTGGTGQDCTAAGFPRVVATPQMRDTHIAVGRIKPGGRAKAGLYAVDMDNPPAPPDEGGSRWAGMSGAAVLVDGFLVGVVVQDPAGFDSRQLLSVPITRALADPGFGAVIERHCGHVPVLEPVELAVMAERVRPRPPRPGCCGRTWRRVGFGPAPNSTSSSAGATTRRGRRCGWCTDPVGRARPGWPVIWGSRWPVRVGPR